MIITPNSVFLHVPKTGGNFVRELVRPMAIEESQYTHAVLVPPHHYNNVFCFVRNPWSWYVSVYNFYQSGSTQYALPRVKTPILNALGPNATFDDFIRNTTFPTLAFRTKLKNINTIIKNTTLVDLSTDINNPAGLNGDESAINFTNQETSFYYAILERYVPLCTIIGKYENLRSDLVKILTQTGEITDALVSEINKKPPVNTGYYTDDYRLYYTDETKKLVADSSKEMIDRFGYEF